MGPIIKGKEFSFSFLFLLFLREKKSLSQRLNTERRHQDQKKNLLLLKG